MTFFLIPTLSLFFVKNKSPQSHSTQTKWKIQMILVSTQNRDFLFLAESENAAPDNCCRILVQSHKHRASRHSRRSFHGTQILHSVRSLLQLKHNVYIIKK